MDPDVKPNRPNRRDRTIGPRQAASDAEGGDWTEPIDEGRAERSAGASVAVRFAGGGNEVLWKLWKEMSDFHAISIPGVQERKTQLYIYIYTSIGAN